MKNSVTVYRNAKVNYELAKKFQEHQQRTSTIEDFVHNFLGEFISEETKKAYIKDLMFFFDFLKSGGAEVSHPRDIKSFHFQLYRDDMMDRKLASATVARRLVAIRSFVKWSVASRLMDHNPLDTIKLPRVQTESPTLAFDDKEALAMIAAPSISAHRGRVHRLILVFLFNLGLRRAEMVNVRVGDVVEDRGHRVLRVRGKGDKIRLIPLHDFVLHELNYYLNKLAENKVHLEADDYLFQLEEGRINKRPIDGATVYRAVDRYAKQLKINKRVSPHSCRATVISHLLDTIQAPIRDVATFAGHANITTTERYDKRRNNLDKSAAYSVDYARGED